MVPDYRLCRLIGGHEDGAIVTLQLEHFRDGTVYALRPCEAQPDHSALYRGDLPFDERMPILEFQGWMTKDLSTTSTTEQADG